MLESNHLPFAYRSDSIRIGERERVERGWRSSLVDRWSYTCWSKIQYSSSWILKTNDLKLARDTRRRNDPPLAELRVGSGRHKILCLLGWGSNHGSTRFSTCWADFAIAMLAVYPLNYLDTWSQAFHAMKSIYNYQKKLWDRFLAKNLIRRWNFDFR